MQQIIDILKAVATSVHSDNYKIVCRGWGTRHRM